MICLLPLLLVAALASAADFVVDVDMDDVAVDVEPASAVDRTLLCCEVFGRSSCVANCAAQLCSSSCTARCGFLRTCAPLSCQTIAASTCVADAAATGTGADTDPGTGTIIV